MNNLTRTKTQWSAIHARRGIGPAQPFAQVSSCGSRWMPALRRMLVAGLTVLSSSAGCMRPIPTRTLPPRPEVAPTSQTSPVEPLELDASHIQPMYTQMLTIDLPTVVKVAAAENFDIKHARQAVEARRGQLESAVGRAFPAIVPTAIFEHVEGTVRATEGNLLSVGFNTFQPSIAIQWVVNPGRVLYDIVAAKKRLLATEHQQQAVILETLHRSAVQYYTLVLAQARVSAANQGVIEAQELLRINRLRLRTGTGVPADELRAEARLAQRRQDLVSAFNDFYEASIALTVTLHLEPSVTLVPSIETLPPTHLVRDDLSIDTLLEIAVTFRPDLESVRVIVEAVAAERGATWWTSLGPQLNLSYQYGGITGSANNVVPAEGVPGNLILNPASTNGSFSSNTLANGLIKQGILQGSRRLGGRGDQTFGFSDQQRAGAGVAWRLSLSTFGELKVAKAVEQQAIIEAKRRLDRVKAQVVSAVQASKTHNELTALARQQVASGEEALRLSEVNLETGTMTTLDVLQAQDVVTQARLRYAEAVVHYNQSQVDLLAAIGLLDEQSL